MAFLAVPEPFDFELTTGRFRTFGVDLANLWHEGGLHRVIGGREVRIEAARGGVDVEPFDDAIESEVRVLLGFAFELGLFEAFARADEVLAPIYERLRGMRPPLAPNPFEMLVGAISAQQVSLKAAFAIRNRYVQKYGVRGEHAYAFPTRERTAELEQADLTVLGFSGRKAEYIVGLARADIDLDELRALPDDEVKSRLTALRGLGEWTADWFLARHLARPRAWPAGDLGLRRAVEAFVGGGTPMTTQDVRTLAERFAPFENLSAHYLLSGLYAPAAA